MIKKLSNLPFCSTKEQEEKLDAIIAANKHDKSRVMAVMQEAQGIYGYLPIEVQNKIAEILEKFETLVNDIAAGLPAEIEARQKQYEYYRDKLLNFKEMSV